MGACVHVVYGVYVYGMYVYFCCASDSPSTPHLSKHQHDLHTPHPSPNDIIRPGGRGRDPGHQRQDRVGAGHGVHRDAAARVPNPLPDRSLHAHPAAALRVHHPAHRLLHQQHGLPPAAVAAAHLREVPGQPHRSRSLAERWVGTV